MSVASRARPRARAMLEVSLGWFWGGCSERARTVNTNSCTVKKCKPLNHVDLGLSDASQPTRARHQPRPDAMLRVVALLLAAAPIAASGPLDDYINAPEPAFAWRDTAARVKLPLGGTAHILNVTSLQWLTVKEAIGPNGALWTHQVAVVVPKRLTGHVALSVMTGGCNNGHGSEGPKPPSKTEEYMILADVLAFETGAIAIVIYQIPNCKIVYPSDPARTPREEDAMISWAWRQFLEAPNATRDPRWLPRLPMAKAGFQCMRAAEQFILQQGLRPHLDGWFVGGASKRGWTSWMVGAANCSSCVATAGLLPLVHAAAGCTPSARWLCVRIAGA